MTASVATAILSANAFILFSIIVCMACRSLRYVAMRSCRLRICTWSAPALLPFRNSLFSASNCRITSFLFFYLTTDVQAELSVLLAEGLYAGAKACRGFRIRFAVRIVQLLSQIFNFRVSKAPGI